MGAVIDFEVGVNIGWIARYSDAACLAADFATSAAGGSSGTTANIRLHWKQRDHNLIRYFDRLLAQKLSSYLKQAETC